MRLLQRLSLLVLLAGCGGTSTPDGGADVSAADVQAVADVQLTADVSCVLSPPAATLPMVNGRVAIEGGDAGLTPTASGGDPEGRWLIDDATLWLPAAAQGQVDTSASWIRGSGWATIQGGQYEISTDLGLRVEAVVGGLTRGVVLGGRGRYEVRGTELALTPMCMTSAAAQGSLGSFRFSRDAPTRGRLFVELVGMAGRTTLIFQLQLAP
jgi:hypothetical protein